MPHMPASACCWTAARGGEVFELNQGVGPKNPEIPKRDANLAGC